MGGNIPHPKRLMTTIKHPYILFFMILPTIWKNVGSFGGSEFAVCTEVAMMDVFWMSSSVVDVIDDS